MATKKRQLKAEVQNEETIMSAFLRGFFLPFNIIFKGLAWLSHRPPLKQVGHGLKYIGNLMLIRFFAKVTGLRYVYRSWKELRNVSWPTFRDSVRLTSAVVIFSVVFGILIAITDYGLDKLFKNFILK